MQLKLCLRLTFFFFSLAPPGCWRKTSSSPCCRGVWSSCSKTSPRRSGALAVSLRSFLPSSSSWTVSCQNQGGRALRFPRVSHFRKLLFHASRCRSRTRSGRRRHLPCEESSEENRPVPAAKGCFSYWPQIQNHPFGGKKQKKRNPATNRGCSPRRRCWR